MSISSFRDLRVWQLGMELGMELVEDVYGLTRSWPQSERYGLTSQVRRSAISVPSNIAEGQAREHLGEYLHHLSVAQASLAELDTQLEIAIRLEYLSADQTSYAIDKVKALGKQLRALRAAVSKSKSNT